jgi:hypothetical protein
MPLIVLSHAPASQRFRRLLSDRLNQGRASLDGDAGGITNPLVKKQMDCGGRKPSLDTNPPPELVATVIQEIVNDARATAFPAAPETEYK